ncbi:hypothetical protein [Blastochloris sulfoviridis]|nr:hypothetical protein [Blastochloris sulfoviridis]
MTDTNLAFVLTDPVALQQLVAPLLVLPTIAAPIRARHHVSHAPRG